MVLWVVSLCQPCCYRYEDGYDIYHSFQTEDNAVQSHTRFGDGIERIRVGRTWAVEQSLLAVEQSLLAVVLWVGRGMRAAQWDLGTDFGLRREGCAYAAQYVRIRRTSHSLRLGVAG